MLNLVEAIHGVWHWSRRPHYRFRSNSPSGHTIHYMERGSYELTLNGVTRLVQAGDMVFYGSIEDHSWLGNETETSFYSINYQPRELGTLGNDQRIVPTDGAPGQWFAAAYQSFQNGGDPGQRALCFAAVYQILGYAGALGLRPEETPVMDLWGSLERTILQKRMFRVSIQSLSSMSGYNASTVYRACKAAHGTSPLARLRTIRMEEARNLLVHSNLPINAIASELGFPRIHEFCREFARIEGTSPAQYRLGQREHQSLKKESNND